MVPFEACQITSIKKIYNCVIYERFVTELKNMLKKYKDKTAFDIMKHLFHGTRDTNPEHIYQSQDGLDHRFSADGLMGYGVYFADNAHYSNTYAHNTGYAKQMLLSLVLIGESTS